MVTTTKPTEMTQSEFQTYAEGYINALMDKLRVKGMQYSKDSAFSNFVEGAAVNGMTPQAYLMALATKHWHNLCKFPFNTEERASDVIIYMLLLEAMNS